MFQIIFRRPIEPLNLKKIYFDWQLSGEKDKNCVLLEFQVAAEHKIGMNEIKTFHEKESTSVNETISV